MTQDLQNNTLDIDPPTRYGYPLYEENPSLNPDLPTRFKTNENSKTSKAYLIASEAGEVIGRGVFGIIEEKEVDSEQFVKLYLAGIRQYGNLTKAGAILFEFVYKQLSDQNSRDKDTIAINFLLAQRWRKELSRRTYERGMRELLCKEFLYRSLTADIYFVNVRFMFNGNRMILAQSYRRKLETSLISSKPPLQQL